SAFDANHLIVTFTDFWRRRRRWRESAIIRDLPSLIILVHQETENVVGMLLDSPHGTVSALFDVLPVARPRQLIFHRLLLRFSRSIEGPKDSSTALSKTEFPLSSSAFRFALLAIVIEQARSEENT